MSDELEAAIQERYAGQRNDNQAIVGRWPWAPSIEYERMLEVEAREPGAAARLGIGIEFGIYRAGRDVAIADGRFDADTWRQEQGIG